MTFGKQSASSVPRNIKLTIQYDGRNYSGWQIQRGKRTVQGEIAKAIRRVTNEDVVLIGASRTDAGVHAFGQVANFKTFSKITCERLIHAINFYLDQDISVLRAENVARDFHAQFCAKGKRYLYRIINSYTRHPLVRDRFYHIRPDLDVARMKKGARLFLGTHDFRAFGSDVGRKKTTVRTIYSLKVSELPFDGDGEASAIEISCQGNGFLYNMVRCMVGTLIRVGKGTIKPQYVKTIIKDGLRSEAGPVAPPHGLYLMEVYY